MNLTPLVLDTWTALVATGCIRRDYKRAGLHVVEIVQDGRIVGIGEGREIRLAFLAAVIEAVQMVMPKPQPVVMRPVPRGLVGAPAQA